jgi:glycyl-tRNA synthetase beta chain
MPELLIEIGSEEIPAGYIGLALDYLETELTGFLKNNRLEAGEAKTFGTPRRLVVCVSDVSARQEDVTEIMHGPNVKAAYDAEGKPTKAAIGFARGKGIDVEKLTVVKTAKGEVVCATVEKKGEDAVKALNEYLPGLISGIPFPKKMRWAEKKVAFARPVHWVASLFGGATLNFSMDGIQCGNDSLGHRFLNPDKFQFNDLNSYLAQCDKHFVAVDREGREKLIAEQMQVLASEVGGVIKDDPDLLSEVANLVEYPTAIRCDFESQYLELPKELLVMTMKVHQRYFPIWDAEDKLLPYFITVSNIKPGPGDEIKNGNKRVLRARLEDARFFYDEDKKKKLEDFVDELKGIVFQKKLGTSFEKMERFTKLAEHISHNVCPDDKENVKRAALLCKADLVTAMVYEFPELQGVMGGYYAEHSGEDAETALAIKEHYRPAFAGDDPPSNSIGASVAIADKLDTIIGCISVGLIPSGSEDPYALRRHSLGIIQIILDRDWQISLGYLIDKEIQLLEGKAKLSAEDTKNHVLDLFRQRFKTFLSGEDYPYDAIDAVLSTGFDSLVDSRKKVEALSELKKQTWFESLATAFRRVVSILTEDAPGEVDPKLLQEDAEKALYETYLVIKDPVEKSIADKKYPDALANIVEIKSAVDLFFDKVMVMVEDEAIKKNRLHLLYNISQLFSQLADFSKIVVKKG